MGLARMPGILVYSDDEDTRYAILRVLSSFDYPLAEADRLEDVCAQLTTRSVDLLLCDFASPRSEALAVLEMTRSHHPKLPVIGLTSGGLANSADQLRRAIEFGGVSILQKPFDSETLLTTVAQLTKAARVCERTRIAASL